MEIRSLQQRHNADKWFRIISSHTLPVLHTHVAPCPLKTPTGNLIPVVPSGVPYPPLTLTVIVELSTLRYNALKNYYKNDFSPRCVSPLVDAYKRFFEVLHGDQLSCCNRALKNASLCRKNNDLQIWENRIYDDDNEFVFLKYKKGYLELMVHIDGQVVVYDPWYDPWYDPNNTRAVDHRYLPFRHKFSRNIDIDRNELSDIEDGELPQPTKLSSDNECVADVCLGLLIVINHLNMCQIKVLSRAFGDLNLDLLSVNAPRMGGRWGYEHLTRSIRSVRTLQCKNRSGPCFSVSGESAESAEWIQRIQRSSGIVTKK